jgi:hypothetical protein
MRQYHWKLVLEEDAAGGKVLAVESDFDGYLTNFAVARGATYHRSGVENFIGNDKGFTKAAARFVRCV